MNNFKAGSIVQNNRLGLGLVLVVSLEDGYGLEGTIYWFAKKRSFYAFYSNELYNIVSS